MSRSSLSGNRTSSAAAAVVEEEEGSGIVGTDSIAVVVEAEV
jgi:hypothetical protein